MLKVSRCGVLALIRREINKIMWEHKRIDITNYKEYAYTGTIVYNGIKRATYRHAETGMYVAINGQFEHQDQLHEFSEVNNIKFVGQSEGEILSYIIHEGDKYGRHCRNT